MIKNLKYLIASNVSFSGEDGEISSGSTIVIVVVFIVVFLASVSVILPFLYYKHKYPKFRVTHKVLPKASDNLKNTGPEVNLSKHPEAVASGSKSPNLQKSSSQGILTQDTKVPKENLI
jgi:flagellar basal body-associated protein FliL